MCGIFFTNVDINNISVDYIIEFLKRRGPDLTTINKINEYTFIHTLLSMTGPLTEQPFYNNDKSIIIIYNGEIYNFEDFGNFNSDGECLIPLYEKYGDEFIKYLDGEFAIVLVDFNQNKLLFSTDIFGTRPLWVSFNEKKFGISSYKSCLERSGLTSIFQVLANKTYIYDLKEIKCIKEFPVHVFDLNQYKTNFDDWNNAFSNAILKRTKNAKCKIFIGLSAGYDSGSIACELNKQNIDFDAYCIIDGENKKIIYERAELLKKINIINIVEDDFTYARNNIKNKTEFYIPNIDDGDESAFFNKYNNKLNEQNVKELEQAIKNRKRRELSDDNGAIGCSLICNKAINNGCKIYLSGSGADEIFSDYGFDGVKIFGHSTIGGYYPENLHLVFPWKNFFGNSQRAYLMKEEYITGSYGIEGRYPFLDKKVVQEFLWISHELKNKIYKAPLDNYLTENKFPFEQNQKLGFSCGYSGISGNDKNFNKLNENQLNYLTTQKINTINISEINFSNWFKKTYENLNIIDKTKIIHIEKNLYYYPISINHPGIKYCINCPYYLLENNNKIGKTEIDKDSIKKIGYGLFCFYSSSQLYFSTSDNSNPIYNNKIYTFNSY